MAVRYNRIKQMKSSKIGTMMAWTADGIDGNLVTDLPKGWILCDGRTYPAGRYPLLASLIGDTYGGSNFAGTFPDYAGTFKVPNLSSRMPIDLEPSMLVDATYQYGQSDAGTVLGTLVSGYGDTTPVQTLISANADIVFTLLNTSNMVGKMTNMTITDPDFGASIYMLPRKLGIAHIPSHGHPGTYNRATVIGSGPMVFQSARMQLSGTEASGCGCPSGGQQANNIDCQLLEASKVPTWQNGAVPMTYFADVDREHTIVSTDRFFNFVQTGNTNPGSSNKTVTGSQYGKDWQHVPAYTWPTNLKNEFFGSPFSSSFLEEPMITHSQDAWSGMFPKPGIYSNRRNFFGYDTGITGSTGVIDDPELVAAATYSVSLPATLNRFSLPAGADIGAEFDKIKPFMTVSGTYIPEGAQILGIERKSGTSTADYVYEIEMSEQTTNTSVQTVTVSIRHGTFPTTMNNLTNGQNPNSSTFQGHTHGSFDIAQGVGSLVAPATHPVSGEITGVSLGNVNPENIDDALNIIADTQMPSVNCTFMIKAY
jgi:hypothetical protein